MKRSLIKAVPVVAALLAACAGFTGDAGAHSFNVALVVAQPGAPLAEVREVRDGFLLATRERDSHPDEESDGHLGGLDVYVHPVDLGQQPLSAVRALMQQEGIDVVAVIGPEGAVEDLRPLVAGTPAVLLDPGRLPSPIPAAFSDTFEAAFGYPPGIRAAEGYNAGRRIDAAVRPLGGVGDREALRRAFDQTRDGLSW